MEKQKKNTFSIRMPPDLDKKMTEYIAKIGISKSAFICNLVFQAMNEEPKKNNCAEGETNEVQ